MKLYSYKIQREFVKEIEPEQVMRPESVAQIVRLNIDFSREQEHLVALYLNGRNQVTGSFVVSIGSLDASIVHPREVFKPAILASAAAVIIAHNHPSGDVTPSAADLQVHKRIKEAGDLLGIRLLDALVVSEDRFHSAKENGEI